MEQKINKKIAANIGHTKEESLELTREAFCDRARKNAEYIGDDYFGSLFGIAFEASKEEFFALMKALSNIWTEGSGIVMDYATEEYEGDAKTRYEYFEMEHLLSECGFRIYEHLDNTEAEDQLFYQHNLIKPRKQIKPPKGVCYCLAVRKW